MEVLIVSKTRMGNYHVCVGGVDLTNYRSLRLMEVGRNNPPANTPYEIGDVWDINYQPCQTVTPPHVEDAVVLRRALLRQNQCIARLLGDHVRVWQGCPDVLFNSSLLATNAGSGYISRAGHIPNISTGFWRPNRELYGEEYNDAIKYRFPGGSRIRFIKYVGTQPAIDEIPAGTLLRVSLARWWRAADQPETEERCYLQLSGWYDINPDPVNQAWLDSEKDQLPF